MLSAITFYHGVSRW